MFLTARNSLEMIPRWFPSSRSASVRDAVDAVHASTPLPPSNWERSRYTLEERKDTGLPLKQHLFPRTVFETKGVEFLFPFLFLASRSLKGYWAAISLDTEMFCFQRKPGLFLKSVSARVRSVNKVSVLSISATWINRSVLVRLAFVVYDSLASYNTFPLEHH